MADFSVNDWITLGAVVKTLPSHGRDTYSFELKAFEHVEASPQLIPISSRGAPIPKAPEPIYSRTVNAQPTDTSPPTMDLREGLEVRLVAIVTAVEGVGEQAQLKVNVVGQLLRGPAAEAAMAPPVEPFN